MNRVCIVRHNYYPEEAHVRRDAKALMDAGYQVDVICLRRKGQKRREVLRGVEVYRLPVEHHRTSLARYAFEYSTFFVLVFLTLVWLSLRRKYQAVEIDAMPGFLVFAAVPAKLLGARLVLYIFDHMPEVYQERFGTGPRHAGVMLLRALETASARWADHVITVNSLCRELLTSRGIPESKLSVVLNVPDEDIFRPQVRSANGRGSFRLITHGTLLERYGVQTLLEAVPILRREIPELRVKIVGEGEYRPVLEELAEALGIQESVQLTGAVPFEEVPSLIAEADIGVVPVLADRNPMLPNKLLEYLALGKATVATSIPAVKTYFDTNSVSFYDPGDAQGLACSVLELYWNPERRAALAESGLAAYKHYRWAAMKREYLNVFNELAGPHDCNDGGRACDA